MSLGITVLGCAGTWSSAESGCSSYLVDDGTTRVWIDCGPGALSALQHHCQLADVDALVVTHSHPDHCIELPVIRNAMKYGLDIDGMAFYSPKEVLDLLDAIVGRSGVAPPFRPHVVADGSQVEVGTLRLTFSRTDHPVETLAVRIDPLDGSGPAIVYSADTAAGWSMRAFGDGIGIGMVEATTLADLEGTMPHLSARQAGADARAAGVARLVITHITPTGDHEAHRREAEEAFGGPVEVARPHERYAT